MTKAVRSMRRKFLRWHKTIGLVVGIPLLVSVVTGLLLQYPELIFSEPETTLAITIDPLQPTHWIKGTDLGLYHSFDNGVSWQESPLMWSPGSIRKLVFSPDNSRTVYALGSEALLVSQDSGRIWDVVQMTLPEEMGWGEFVDLSLGQGGVLGILTRAGMILSEDGGQSWMVKNRAPAVPGAKVLGIIHDLHTGYWIGSLGAWSVTIIATGTLLLVCSGFVLVLLRRKRGNNSRD